MLVLGDGIPGNMTACDLPKCSTRYHTSNALSLQSFLSEGSFPVDRVRTRCDVKARLPPPSPPSDAELGEKHMVFIPTFFGLCGIAFPHTHILPFFSRMRRKVFFQVSGFPTEEVISGPFLMITCVWRRLEKAAFSESGVSTEMK